MTSLPDDLKELKPAPKGARGTEKHKMLNGHLYTFNADDVLIEEQERCQDVILEYNRSTHREWDKRTRLLRSLFGRIGDNSFIKPPFQCDYGYNIEIGKNFFANYNCVFLDCNKISIGDDVQIAPNVQICTAGHPLEPYKRRALLEYAKPVKIGNNVWIGGSAVICPGVTIGDNSVVAAGAIVVKDVPPNCVVGGNPAKVLRGVDGFDKNVSFAALASAGQIPA